MMGIVADPGEKQQIQISARLQLGELTLFPPAVAYHKGNMWVAWVGEDKQLNIVKLDRQNDGRYIEDRASKHTLNSTSDNAPSLASDGNRLYMAFIGVGNHQVNIVSSVNGNDFEPASKNILNSESGFAPQLAVLNGQLFVAFTGVNGGDFSIVGPATVDGNGKADFKSSDKKTFPNTVFSTFLSMCAYDKHLVFAGTGPQNSVLLYRWAPGQNLPATPFVTLPVKGWYVQCAAARSGTSPGNLWISSLFTTGQVTERIPGYGPVFGDYFWYAYRVVDNPHQSADIQGVCSIFGDGPQGYAVLAVSDDGNTVNVAWMGTDSPAHVNVGTIPAGLTGR